MTRAEGWSRGERGRLNLPESHLFQTLAGHLETGRLRIAVGAPLTKDPLRELSGFEVSVTAAGNLVVDVRAADHHGDLAVATALTLFGAVCRTRGAIEVGKLANWD